MSNDPEDKGFEKSLGKQSADRGEKDVAPFEGEDEHGFAPDVGHGQAQKEAGDKAFEADKHETQEGSKSEGGAIYAPEKSAEHSGESITARGEERGSKKDEPGRIEEEEQEAGRPKGKTTARYSTGVNPTEMAEEDAPHMPHGDQGG
ncbi:MAG: hypothetical protein ABR529_08945 [Actinomycetota bacterium]